MELFVAIVNGFQRSTISVNLFSSPFQNGYTPYKALAGLPFQYPPKKVTWSKSSILVAAVVLDPQAFKFAERKDLKKISPSNNSKSDRLNEDINFQKVLEG